MIVKHAKGKTKALATFVFITAEPSPLSTGLKADEMCAPAALRAAAIWDAVALSAHLLRLPVVLVRYNANGRSLACMPIAQEHVGSSSMHRLPTCETVSLTLDDCNIGWQLMVLVIAWIMHTVVQPCDVQLQPP